MRPNSPSLPVVIVGGGFAGVTLAQHLERQLDNSVEIVVVSRDNHLVFTPMLAEVAARTVSPLHVVVAGRQMTKRTRWIAASTTSIDLNSRRIYFEGSYGSSSIEFGDLVLACGMDVNLHEIPGMAAHALPLKSIEDAFTLGNALIGKFEQATVETDSDLQAQLITTVVIGGGFSGVEIAGHLHDLAQNICRYYSLAKGVKPRTIIVHRGERVIPELQHQALSEYAVQKLRQNGVDVLLKTGVREISKTEVHLSDGTRLPYGLLAGTVGNTAGAFIKEAALPLERNRLKTNGAMQVEGHDSIWALGDCAVVPNAFDQKPSPPTAQFALRQAKQMAGNICRSRRGQALTPFRFRPQGLLASIGNRNGVAEVYRVKFSGILAWFFWRGVYLMKMPSFSRKVGIAVDWFLNILFPENLVRIGNREAKQIRREHFVAGDVVYRKGEPARSLYLVERGIAAVRVAGEEEPVTRLQQGEHFGLSSMEENQTLRSTTVVAESDLDLIVFERFGDEDVSGGMLNRELKRLKEVRQIRKSWKNVLERIPGLDTIRVADAMTKSPAVFEDTEPLQSVFEKIASTPNVFLVSSDGSLVGYCGRKDINAALGKGMPPDTPAREFMSPITHTLSPELEIRNGAFNFTRSGLDVIPVVDHNNRLIGMFGLIEAAQLLLARESTLKSHAKQS